MKVNFSHKGSFSKTERFLKRASDKDLRPIFERYGRLGVTNLERSTPIDTGVTRSSWHYNLEKTSYGYNLSWYNTEMAGNTPLVILIQYGHGTRGGTFVQGIDFINPAMASVLDDIANDIWKEVTIV